MKQMPKEFNVKQNIMNVVIIISSIVSFSSALINVFNKRPPSNVLMPTIISVLFLLLFISSYFFNKHIFVKRVYLFILCVAYLPPAWLTSPGSMSAMPLYALLIIIAATALVEDKFEYLYPIIALLEVLVLLSLEMIYPNHFDVYTDFVYRSKDIAINFTLIASISIVLLFAFNQYHKWQKDVLYNLSITDQLTGLYNRRHLIASLEFEHMQMENHHSRYAILMIDINHFKQVNDTYGHLEGDRLLQSLSQILKSHSRSYDIVGRYGGDEFLVILPKTGYEDAVQYSERFKTQFLRLCEKYSNLNVSISIGVETSEHKTIKDILHLADKKLYQDKLKIKQHLTN